MTFVNIDDPINNTSCTFCIESKIIFHKDAMPSEGFRVWTFDFATGPGIGLPLVPPERPPDFEPKQIEGLLCHGYLLRVSQERIVEYWYSVDLNQLILVKIQSEEGEYTWRLINIRLTEPDESLFTVPLDYKYAYRER